MSSETDNFFEGKRPWSKIKDRIFSSYMHVYLAKINHRGDPIILIDAFAGPGVFDDGSPGSPFIMCSAAEKYVKGKYQAFFVNEKAKYHQKLESVLQKGGWFPQATSVLGDSQDFLKRITPLLRDPKDHAVFLYLDPFGLKDCMFSTVEPFLNRNRRTSTEIVINLSMPIIHRLAGREKTKEGTIDPEIRDKRSDLLTRVLGGDYWKEPMLSEGLETKERERLVIEGYQKQLSKNGYLRFTGACPISPTRDGATKYYMVFASAHRDTKKIFNDEMIKAFNEYMNQQEMADTLFADLSWKDWRDLEELKRIVCDYILNNPGVKRLDLWHLILGDHFLRFTETEYRQSVKALFEQGIINSPTPRPRPKQLNDDCLLYITQNQ